ncbi:hypothetical protein [Pseudarthrobacter sp. C4D7]|uniref:hypothetical protein n=1 Tax=Pseudarthrobacter sp. C4D7 TaxID=2735268 RepID=UPI001584E43D|nr:hypothetical protein [Pseudarthrobacter sp. C4D7]NUT72093.1 hypothetical protein [Pseudarthrobacter sp. C4D7]
MHELPRPQSCTHPTAACHGCRAEMREAALREAPGKPIVLLRPAPVTVRSAPATALAYTVTDVLIEWEADSGYHLRWEASWLVRRVQATGAAMAGHEAHQLQEAV